MEMTEGLGLTERKVPTKEEKVAAIEKAIKEIEAIQDGLHIYFRKYHDNGYFPSYEGCGINSDFANLIYALNQARNNANLA